MTYKCKFCNAILSTEWSLQNHQKRTKKCLDKQGIVPKGEFKCNICNELFSYKSILTTHSITCSKKRINIELESKYNDLQSRYNELESKYNIIESTHNTIIEDKKILEVRYDNLFDKITTSALSKTSNNTDIEECQSNISGQTICKSDGLFNCPLTLDNGSIINIHMRTDGYINATMLCKAGNKRFNHWFDRKETVSLTHALETDTGIPASQLINIKKGNSGKFSQGSWIHPDLAVQLAQWISPMFAIKVSRWTRELLLFGKVQLGQEKSNNELDNEFKSVIYNTTEKKLSIDMEPYHEKDVLYIYNVNPKEELNIQIPQDKHCYEFGVTSNIKQRDSAYNNDKCYDKVRLDRIVEYKDRNSLARGEKRIKTIVKDLGLKLEVKNKKECFIANKDEYDRIYDNIIEHSNSINDKSSTKSNDKEENEFSIELEKYRIDKEKEKELEIEKNTTDVEIKKYKIDKDNENERTKKIMEMFENGKLTFEQMDKLLTSSK